MGEAVGDYFALVAEEEVRGPGWSEVLLHESQGVGRHLLAVVALGPGLEVGMEELGRHDGIGRAGGFELWHVHTAAFLVNDLSFAAGHGAEDVHGPLDGFEVGSGEIVGWWRRFGLHTCAEDRIHARAALGGRTGIRVRLVAGAKRELGQGGGTQAHWLSSSRALRTESATVTARRPHRGSCTPFRARSPVRAAAAKNSRTVMPK